MARAQVELPEEVALRPQASAADTYSQPAKSPLWAAAQALGRVDNSVQAFLAEGNTAKDKEDERLKGEAYAMRNPEAAAEAVRSGNVPSFASPHFVRGMKAATGSTAGYDLETKATAEFEKLDKTNLDDAGLRKWQADFLKANVTSEDPGVLKGLLPHIHAIQESTTNAWISSRDKSTKEQALTQYSANGFKGAMQPTLKGEAPDFSQVSRAREEYAALGGDVKLYDKNVMEMAASEATTGVTGNEAALGIFKEKVPGETYTYGETPDGKKLWDTAKDTLTRMKNAAVGSQHTQQKYEDDKASADAKIAMLGILKDPNATIPEDLFKQAERGDPEVRSKVAGWRKDMASGGVSDPEALKSVTEDIIRGGGKQAVLDALGKGIFKNGEDAQKAAAFAQSYENARDKIKDVQSRQSFRQGMDTIKAQTTAGKDIMNPISGMSRAGDAAAFDLNRLVTNWTIANPNATDQEVEDYIAKAKVQVLNSITPSDAFGDNTAEGAYKRPEGLGFDNPLAAPKPGAEPEVPTYEPEPGSPAKPAAPAEAPKTQPLPGVGRGPQPPKAATVDDDTAMEFYAGLTPEQRKGVQALAKTRGQTPVEVAREMAGHAGVTKVEDAPKADKISFTSEDTAGLVNEALGTSFKAEDVEGALHSLRSSVTSLADLDGDEGAAKLLDFVSGPESGGNYNAVYGNADSSDDLSKYSLDDIIGRGSQGKASSATGRYQFITGTLKGLKEELGLSGSEKFTPQLQDKLGLALLKRRGLDDWRSGRIDDKTFAANIAQEWAGLPNPTTGKSAYDGDGLNKSGVSTDAVFRTLGATKGIPPSPAKLAMPTGPRGDPYGLVPDVDEDGRPGQKAKFAEWNPDPVGNTEANLQTLQPDLAAVYKKAALDNPNLKFAVGIGKRDKAQQEKAIQWGWSKKVDSKHLTGSAVDVWPVDKQGRVAFDKPTQLRIQAALKKAASDLGVTIRTLKDDLPHFELVGRNT